MHCVILLGTYGHADRVLAVCACQLNASRQLNRLDPCLWHVSPQQICAMHVYDDAQPTNWCHYLFGKLCSIRRLAATFCLLRTNAVVLVPGDKSLKDANCNAHWPMLLGIHTTQNLDMHDRRAHVWCAAFCCRMLPSRRSTGHRPVSIVPSAHRCARPTTDAPASHRPAVQGGLQP